MYILADVTGVFSLVNFTQTQEQKLLEVSALEDFYVCCHLLCYDV